MGLFGSRNVLSLDFSSDRVKGVLGKYSKKGIQVEKSLVLNLPEGLYKDGEITDIDQFAYLLRNFVSENGLGQYSTYGVINSTSIILREVGLPTNSSEEIESIIRYQLEEYIPINPEDYIVKYILLRTIEKEGIEFSQILLVGMPKTMIMDHLNLLKKANLKPRVLDYHGNAIAKLITEGGVINQGYQDASYFACIDLGYDTTQLSILEDGNVLVARVIDFGLKDLMEDLKIRLPFMGESEIYKKINSLEDISNKPSLDHPDVRFIEILRDNVYTLMDRIKMIIRYSNNRDDGNRTDLILLYGDFSEVKGLDLLFNDFFEIPAVKLQDLSRVKISNDLSEFATATGGLVRHKEVKR